MATLTGQSIANSYKDLLQVSNSNSGIDGTARVVSDGEDTASKLFLDTNRVGVGIAPTDGTLHVHTATAGVVDAPSVTDDLIVENNDHAGIQILSPDDKFGTLGFGSPSDAIAGMVRYDETNKTMIFGTVEGTNAGNVKLVTANEVTALTIDSSQNVGIGTTSPSSTLHVKSASADGYIIAESSEANSNGILEARSASNRDSYVFFREGSTLKAQIFNDSSEDSLVLTDGANSNTVFIKSDNVGIGGDPSNKLDVFSAGDAVLRVKSTTNSSGNDAIFLANVAGSSGGDPMMRFNIDSVGAWSIGVDNDDSDKFKISGLSAVLGNNDRLVIDTSGNVGIGVSDPDSELEIFHTTDPQIKLSINTHGDAGIIVGDADGVKIFGKGASNEVRLYSGASTLTLRVESTGNILPGTDDAQDLGSSSKRFDDIHATNGTIQTSDERLKDNIADSSLGLDFVNALRPVKYQWKDYTYDVEKEKAIEAKEAEYETVVVQEAVEAKEAVMGTRQKTVSKEVEKTKIEIVEEDGKYVQKEVSYTETVEEPQYEEVNLYDEDGEVIGSHKIPIMEEYEVEPAVEAVEEVTEERLVSEAIEAKDAVMETKEKTFARTHFGLIAQEVEQVLKDSSLTNNDFAGLIYDEDSDRYGMRYHELIAPLIKAVQELSKKVTDLENK